MSLFWKALEDYQNCHQVCYDVHTQARDKYHPNLQWTGISWTPIIPSILNLNIVARWQTGDQKLFAFKIDGFKSYMQLPTLPSYKNIWRKI